MNEKEILTTVMKKEGLTQLALAEKAGYTSQSSVSHRLNGKSIRVDTLNKLLGLMGYEIVIRSKKDKSEWVVSE